MKKNNKGFTLIELLAVVVILAIIMIIAVQSINTLIKKSRTQTFQDNFGIILKTADSLMTDEQLDTEHLRRNTDYSTNEYEMFVIENEDDYTILVGAVAEGKYGKISFNVEDFKKKTNYCHISQKVGPFTKFIASSMQGGRVVHPEAKKVNISYNNQTYEIDLSNCQ